MLHVSGSINYTNEYKLCTAERSMHFMVMTEVSKKEVNRLNVVLFRKGWFDTEKVR